MEFTCLQENLARKLSVVNRAVAPKASLSILSNIKIEALKNNQLKLSATNLQWSVTTFLGSQVKKEGKIAIPGNLLTSFVNALPSQKLHFKGTKSTLKVENAQGQARFRLSDVADFPAILEKVGDNVVKLPSGDLRKSLAGVTFAAATDENRPILTGILFSLDGNNLTLVGVDGFRLSESRLKLAESVKEKLEMVVPARSLNELQKLAVSNADVSLSLLSEENQIVVEVGETIISSRLLEGSFPEYEQIIPKDYNVTAKVSVEELRKVIQLSSFFTEGSSNVVKLSLSVTEGKIIVSANAQEVGDATSSVDCEVEGENESIAFNVKYLLDVLSYIDEDEVIVKVKDSVSPGLFQIPDNDSFLHLIMPVRVQE